MSSLNAHLKALLADLTAELPEVTERRMFGSDAFFANGSIFAMAWDGRVLVKLPPERYEVARALEGAGPFDPMGNGKTMSTWVAMPEDMHDDVDALLPWVEEAHRFAMSKPPKGAKKAKPVKAARAPAPRTGRAPTKRASRAGGRKAGR